MTGDMAASNKKIEVENWESDAYEPVKNRRQKDALLKGYIRYTANHKQERGRLHDRFYHNGRYRTVGINFNTLTDSSMSSSDETS